MSPAEKLAASWCLALLENHAISGAAQFKPNMLRAFKLQALPFTEAYV
jgi:hypothetical protein